MLRVRGIEWLQQLCKASVKLCEPHVGLLRKVSRGRGYLRRKKDKSECHVTRIAGNVCRESAFRFLRWDLL